MVFIHRQRTGKTAGNLGFARHILGRGKKAAIVAWGRGGGFGMGSFQTGIGLSIVEFVKYIAGMNMIVWIGY